MATRVFRSQKLRQILDAGIRMKKSMLRLTTSAQSKIVTGPNGEKIIPSPDGEATYPEMLIHDYVWHKCEKFPNKIALECGVTEKKYTYAEANDATSYIGRSLRHMGLKKGDVVAIATPNLPDSVLAFLGALSGGFVVTTLNPQYTVDEISNQLVISNAKAIITSTAIASIIQTAMKASLSPSTPFIVIDDTTYPIPEGGILFDDLITRGKSLPPVKLENVSIDDVAVLPFSSGTTGLPKGVMLTHRNLVSNILMTYISFPSNAKYHETTETHQDVVPAILPFFHIYGMNGMFFPRLAYGAKIVTIPKFIPELYLNVLENNKASILYCVPPLILFLTSSDSAKKHHIEHVYDVISGAAPLSQMDVERFYEKFNIAPAALRFRQGYGLTETSPAVFFENTGKKFSSVGKNIASCDVRLVDIMTNQDIVTPGQTGEILVRGPHVMKGYLNNEAATKETLSEDKWLKTGDIGYFDEDFDFYITERLKELIKVKGFQVAPAELEALLRTHPDVQEAAVIGIPHARYGEVPRAFVVADKSKKPTEEDIKNFLKGKVADYKELEGGVIFMDEIPKNASGKLLRSKLKSMCKP